MWKTSQVSVSANRKRDGIKMAEIERSEFFITLKLTRFTKTGVPSRVLVGGGFRGAFLICLHRLLFGLFSLEIISWNGSVADTIPTRHGSEGHALRTQTCIAYTFGQIRLPAGYRALLAAAQVEGGAPFRGVALGAMWYSRTRSESLNLPSKLDWSTLTIL